ncbi:hypothetical protein ACHAPK_006463 [Fusarium culmorum]
MVYAKDDRQIITTSRRSRRHGKKESATRTGPTSTEDDDPSTFLNLIAMASTGITLCGFVLQFIGLRGMHWSASIAQLGAVLVMVCVKAWVRRRLAKSPACEPLPPGFELDWFMRTLGGIATEAWSGGQCDDPGSVNSHLSGGAKTASNEWSVVTGGTSSLKVSEPGQVSDSQPSAVSILDAQALLDARKSLAHLTEWRGPASAEAVSLARAIECTLDSVNVCLPDDPERLTWNLEVRYSGPNKQRICIPLSKQVGAWNVDASLLEAVLSLWLSSVEEGDSSQNEDILSSINNGRKLQKQKSQDGWLRSRGTAAKQSLRLLGRRSPSLVRDLLWWIPRDLLNVFQIQKNQVESLRMALEMGNHRVVGYNWQEEGSEKHPHQLHYLDPESSGFDDGGDDDDISETSSDDDEEIPVNDNNGKHEMNIADDESGERSEDYDISEDEVESQSDGSEIGTKTVEILGNDSYQSLKALYAMDLFSSFTRAMAKTMGTPIPGSAEEIQSKSDTEDASWNIFTLRNNHLSKLIQNIHNTGLGSLDQIYLSVITPLSREKRLPKVDAVVNLALQRSRRNEHSKKWKEAGNDLIWLFRLANGTFSSRGNIVRKSSTRV